MQEQLEVYMADYQAQQPVGTLGYRHPWGKGAYQFNFHPFWLQSNANVRLGADLQNVSTNQHAMNNIFGCFKDSLPDEWGRGLLEQRERMRAEAEGRKYYRLNEFVYLPMLDDQTRMGAFRFRLPGSRDFLGVYKDDQSYIPTTALNDYFRLVETYETSPEKLTIEMIDSLIRYGAVFGGKRPKLAVIDPVNNVRYMAKVASAKDEYNEVLWEYFCFQLAYFAGINQAFARLITLSGGFHFPHVLLSKRFDRNDKQQRIHYMTARTLLGVSDAADANDGVGYLQLIRAIAHNKEMAAPKADIREIYRRIAFSICIGNHDDHLSNYSFILTPKGWKLAPAYGFRPSNETTMRLLVTEKSNEASLDNLLRVAPMYCIGPKEAESIIQEVRLAVGKWRNSAIRCKIKTKERERFADRLDMFGIPPQPKEQIEETTEEETTEPKE